MSRRPVRVHIKHAVDLAEPRFGVSGGRVRVREIFSEWRSRVDNRSGVSSATMRPPLMMTTRWQTAVASGKNVGAQNDGMGSCQALDQFPDLDDLFGVESDGRFV